jgi:hypothetical protein
VAEFGVIGVIWLIGCGLTVATTLFWVWMLIDCLAKEPSEGNDKLVWALVMLVLPGLGSLLYLFIRRPERIRIYGR